MIEVIKSFTITNAGATNALDLEDLVGVYRISGTASALATDFVISTASTPTDGLKAIIFYTAQATYSGAVVQIFGYNLTQEQALSNMIIFVYCNGTDIELVFCKDDRDINNHFKGYQSTALTLTGDTIQLDPALDKQNQRFTGSGALSGNIDIDSIATPKEGDEFWILLDTTITLGAFTFTVFGTSITANELATGGILLYVVYDTSNVVWRVTKFVTGSLTLATQAEAEAGASNTTYSSPLRVAQYIAYWLLNTAKVTSVNWEFSGTINLSALTASRILELDGSKNIVSIAKATGYNLPLGITAGTVMEGDDSRVTLKKEIYPMSFESGEQGIYEYTVPWDCELGATTARVVSALSGTDAGTITITTSQGTPSSNIITIPLSSAFGTEVSVTPGGAAITLVAGDWIRFTTAKTTVGGKVVTFFNLQV